jgi:hypothetical protein
VVGTKQCVPCPLEFRSNGIGGAGGAAGSIYCPNDKHKFPAVILCNTLSEVMFLVYVVCAFFSFYSKASDEGETHGLVPTTIKRAGIWLQNCSGGQLNQRSEYKTAVVAS